MCSCGKRAQLSGFDFVHINKRHVALACCACVANACYTFFFWVSLSGVCVCGCAAWLAACVNVLQRLYYASVVLPVWWKVRRADAHRTLDDGGVRACVHDKMSGTHAK